MRSNLREPKKEAKPEVSFKRSAQKKMTYKELKPRLALESVKDYKRRLEETPERKHHSNKSLVFSSFEEGRKYNTFYEAKTVTTTNKNSNTTTTTSTTTTIVIQSSDKTIKPCTKKNKMPYNKNTHVSFKLSGNDNKNGINNDNNGLKNINKTFKKSKSNYILNRPKINDSNNERTNSFEGNEKEIKKNNSILKKNNNKSIDLSGRRNEPDISKYQRIIDIKPNTKDVNNTEDDEWDIEQYRGYRKKTIDITHKKKYNLNINEKLNKINSEFSKLEYVKISKAISVAGKGENGLKKTNQDSYICEKNINGVLNFNIFGVLDGHGVNGHFVSQFVSKFIINRIKNNPLIKNLDSAKDIYQKLKSNGYEIIATTFTDADVEVAKEKFDCLRSGTTCVVVIQLDEHIICANAGDSRSIMIFDDIDNDNLKNTKIYPLSYDCKPELPNESKRIFASGGSVEQFIDENNKGVGPFRVFIKGQENPGLAMSRSIGDKEAKTCGVIPNPQIIEYNISSKTKYMITCSDGIWEFISNEEAMEIGNKYYLKNDPLGLCNELINKSTEIWKREDIVIDDITVVVVFY